MPKSDRGIHIRLRCEDLIALYRALTDLAPRFFRLLAVAIRATRIVPLLSLPGAKW